MMWKTVLAAALVVGTAGAALADPSCAARSADKKLAGAAKASFMKKCQTDAAKACDTQATDRKLAGAARTSFTRKCATDAAGT